MPLSINGLSEYPDFFAFAITILVTGKQYFLERNIIKLYRLGILILGVRESSTMNNIFTTINLFVVLFVFICGLIKINFHNWKINPVEVNNILKIIIIQ